MPKLDGERDIDIGNLDVILAATKAGYRTRHFPIPVHLTLSRQQVLALAVDRRAILKEPRLLLRKAIDGTVRGYKLRMKIKNPSAKEMRNILIDDHVRPLRKLMGLNSAAARKAKLAHVLQQERPALTEYLLTNEAKAASLTTSPKVRQSALDWFVRELKKVFKRHLGADPTTSLLVDSDDKRIYYSPFISFVLAVAGEAKIKIAPSTIHKICTTEPPRYAPRKKDLGAEDHSS